MIPRERQVNHMLVPPMLTKGSGCPVTGTRFTPTAMFTKACSTRLSAKPTATSAPNGFSHLLAIRMARESRIR